MIKQNDRVRVLDNNEVIEGIVASTFESNGVDYIQIHGGRVYTTDEVTKVPQSPVSASNQYLEPQEAPSIDTEEAEQLEVSTPQREANEQYEWNEDDRPMEYREVGVSAGTLNASGIKPGKVKVEFDAETARQLAENFEILIEALKRSVEEVTE